MSNFPAPVGADGIFQRGQLLHTNTPPVLWAPGVAYTKFLEKSDEVRHILGSAQVPGQDGVEAVEGGYRQRHERGDLYLKSVAGAMPYALSQSVAVAYDQIGNTRSFLGFPTDDFKRDPDDDEAFVTYFENGYIFSWPDVGAVTIRELLIKFSGFHCFGETNELSGSDEPYFINGVLPIITGSPVSSMSRIYDDVDAGMSVPDDFLMFQGPPQALLITITLFEHDEGDPNTYKALVDKALDKAAEGATAAIATLPVVGAPLAAVGQIAYSVAGPSLKQEVNSWLGTADDRIATTTLPYSAKDVLRLARTAGAGGQLGRIETPLLSGGGASYKAYFDFVIVQ